MRYASAAAFRMALEENISRLHKMGIAAIPRLRKRIAFERLVKRLQFSPDSPWIVKGAVALDLRFGNRARATKDLDLGIGPSSLGSTSDDPAEIAGNLQAAAANPFEDFFVFNVPGKGENIPLEAGVRAYRFRVRASLAGRPFEEFRADVGTGIHLVAPPEDVPESDTLAFAGIAPGRFRVISLSQHFADKVHALTFPWKDRENTRVKDLVDIVLILEVSPPSPASARHAIEAVFERRDSHLLPARIPDPPPWWAALYTASAAEIRLSRIRMDQAVELLRTYWATVFS